jgi:hypothetical protein
VPGAILGRGSVADGRGRHWAEAASEVIRTSR